MMPFLALLKLIPFRWYAYAGIAIAAALYIGHVHHTAYEQGKQDQIAQEAKAHDAVQAKIDVLTSAPSPYVEQYNALDTALRIPMPVRTAPSPCAAAPSELVKRINEHNHAQR